MDNSYGYVNGSNVYTIIDTGSSGILVSSDYFDLIITKLFTIINNKNYVVKNGIVYSQCIDPNTLPSIFFLFNELWIEVKGLDYMLDVSPNKDRSLC